MSIISSFQWMKNERKKRKYRSFCLASYFTYSRLETIKWLQTELQIVSRYNASRNSNKPMLIRDSRRSLRLHTKFDILSTCIILYPNHFWKIDVVPGLIRSLEIIFSYDLTFGSNYCKLPIPRAASFPKVNSSTQSSLY